MKSEPISHMPAKTGSEIVAGRSLTRAMLRGAAQTCPNCGHGSLYGRYLKVNDECPDCNEALHHHRADDAPPYFTIFIVGHIVLAGVLALEQAYAPAAWIHALIWVPLTLALCLWSLPKIKGALIGLQWALGMHGFGDPPPSTGTHGEMFGGQSAGDGKRLDHS